MNTDKENNLFGNPSGLNELIAYQQGSVVSRTLINKKAGTITLFSFDEGQSLSEHTAPFDAFVHVFDGEAEITIGGVPHQLNSGDAIIMPGGIPHAVKAMKQFKMTLVMIKQIEEK
ncbi:MAG: cupin domain-containing protein [Ignavibacteriae bacterium]|nr:cupin domain-containing protein [Ignavibacteriota bacterium]